MIIFFLLLTGKRSSSEYISSFRFEKWDRVLLIMLSLIVIFLPARIFASAEYYKMAFRELQLAKGASLLSEPLEETPWITTIITAEEIKRFGWFNLRNLLEYQPSFYLVQDVNERIIAHRGIFRTVTSHLLFLEDDIDFSLPEFHNFVADVSFSLYGTSRVEIVRGPGASLYGDAAFTGVITMERKALPKTLGIRTGLGDYDQEEADLAFRGRGNTLGELSGLFHYADFEGEEYHGPGYTQLIHSRPRNYSLLLRWQKGPFSLSYRQLLSRYKTPRSQKGYPLSEEDLRPFGSQEKVRQHILSLTGNFLVQGFEFHLTPYLHSFETKTPQVKITHAEGDFLSLNIKLKGKAWGLKGYLIRPHRTGEFLLGAKWEKEDYEKNFIESFSLNSWNKTNYPEQKEKNWAFFIQEKRYFGKNLCVNLGIRYDHYESFGGQWSPRLAFIGKTRKDLTFKLTYGEAFQAPPYFYRQKNRFGYGSSKNLKTEKVSTYQFSIIYQPLYYSYLTLTSYLSHFKDLLVYRPKIRAYDNVGDLDLWGIELESRYLGRNWIGFINYTFQMVRKEENMARISGKRFLYLPRWMVKGGISLQLSSQPKIFLSPQFRLYGRTRTSSDWISSYAVWDLHLLLKQENYEISFKIDNLFDHHYFRGGTVPPYPWPGRLLMLRIGVEF